MIFQFDPSRFSPGERLLWKFGITKADEINLDAIAFELGIRIRRQRLDGAHARLVAVNDRGIITVSTATSLARQRFSIGHEIGHWQRDRQGDGLLACSKIDVAPKNQLGKTAEAEANRFSSDLVLPPYLIYPKLEKREPNIDLARELGEEFQASIPAAAIRIMRQSTKPVAVAAFGQSGRSWAMTNSAWPFDFYVAKQVHHESSAMDLLFAGQTGARTNDNKEPASRWITGDRSCFTLDVRVQSIKRYDGSILSLIRIFGK